MLSDSRISFIVSSALFVVVGRAPLSSRPSADDMALIDLLVLSVQRIQVLGVDDVCYNLMSIRKQRQRDSRPIRQRVGGEDRD